MYRHEVRAMPTGQRAAIPRERATESDAGTQAPYPALRLSKIAPGGNTH
jgi:hypothetical protein